MDTEKVIEIVWQVLNSPAVIAALAGGLVWILNKLYAKHPVWQDFEGSIIAAVKAAEKQIPDDTPDAGKARLNTALYYILKVFSAARGMSANAAEIAELKEGIQIVHAELEAGGNLKPAVRNLTPEDSEN